MKARNLAVMLTDIKGFTDQTSRKSRAQIKELLTKHNELVLPAIEKYHGHVVKTIGDAFLVTFESSTDAVLCGTSIQEALLAFNKDRPQDDRIDIRIAINAGEVSIAEDGDIFGDAVNITSRIEGIAEAGEVFFTESIYLSMNKNEVPSSEIGYRQFKGISDKIKVYKVLREDPVSPQSPADTGFAGEKSGQEPAQEAGAAPKPEAKPGEEEIFQRHQWFSGWILKIMRKFGLMGNVDIEDEGRNGPRKVKIDNGEIRVTGSGKEIHITAAGVKIRNLPKSGEQPESPKSK
ncbi:MAG: adenylate/guanylate cyclase domain-containing protein [Elusimicrobiota bacterium]